MLQRSFAGWISIESTRHCNFSMSKYNTPLCRPAGLQAVFFSSPVALTTRVSPFSPAKQSRFNFREWSKLRKQRSILSSWQWKRGSAVISVRPCMLLVSTAGMQRLHGFRSTVTGQFARALGFYARHLVRSLVHFYRSLGLETGCNCAQKDNIDENEHLEVPGLFPHKHNKQNSEIATRVVVRMTTRKVPRNFCSCFDMAHSDRDHCNLATEFALRLAQDSSKNSCHDPKIPLPFRFCYNHWLHGSDLSTSHDLLHIEDDHLKM